MNPEPPRCADIGSLWPPFGAKVSALIKAMEERGFDPVVFEARRSAERQRWLYGVGRTHQLQRSPVTWTLQSRHTVGKAADIISRRRLWNWPEFYAVLRVEAARLGLETISKEACHVQWRG